MIKFSIVVGVHNQLDLAWTAIRAMVENLDRPEETELVVIDNGSEPSMGMPTDESMPVFRRLANGGIVHRNAVNTGNYPLFKQGLELTLGDVVAFLHSDVFVYQKGWDIAVRAQFEANERLGLLGFIGSTEIDGWGGRGMGTVSNMQGRVTQHPVIQDHKWYGSQAEVHGKRSAGMTIDGSVVDGCVMIFKREVLDQIPFKENMAPHHHYDRLMSLQAIEMGYKVGVLGVEFDHISGQTSNTQAGWQETSKRWFKEHLGINTPQEWAVIRGDWVRASNNPSRGKVPDQWDHCAYLESEYQFLKEYRDEKHLVPLVMGRKI